MVRNHPPFNESDSMPWIFYDWVPNLVPFGWVPVFFEAATDEGCMQICPPKTSSETIKATDDTKSPDLNKMVSFQPGFGGLMIQGQIYNPDGCFRDHGDGDRVTFRCWDFTLKIPPFRTRGRAQKPKVP